MVESPGTDMVPATSRTLMDINGDGLLDRVMGVYYNPVILTAPPPIISWCN